MKIKAGENVYYQEGNDNKILTKNKKDTLFSIPNILAFIALVIAILTFLGFHDFFNLNPSNEQANKLPQQIDLNYFPLTLGNTWVYSGKIEGQTMDSGEKTISKIFDNYTISVEKVIDKDGIHAALINKSFSLADYLENRIEVQKELWIYVGGKVYIVRDTDKIDSYLKTLESTDSTIDDFRYDELAWDFPLFLGEKYSLLDSLVEGGKKYSYNISESKKISMSGIIDNKECFKREILTNPDESYTWFCPGIGIVEEGYTHNGTILNINYKLSQFYIK